jgi:glutamyl/glutaminyl-tRNA synthetase
MHLFCHRIGISKADNNIDMSVLEDCAREVLEEDSIRAFAVMEPVLLTITNWPEGKVEEFEAEVHPKRPELGTRKIPFSAQVYIDREDFSESPPKGYNRLEPGGQVRLKFAYVVTCNEVIKDSSGQVTEIKCTYDQATRAGTTPEGMKRVKGIIQWVSKEHAVACEVSLLTPSTVTASTQHRLHTAPSPPRMYHVACSKCMRSCLPHDSDELGFLCAMTRCTRSRTVCVMRQRVGLESVVWHRGGVCCVPSLMPRRHIYDMTR